MRPKDCERCGRSATVMPGVSAVGCARRSFAARAIMCFPRARSVRAGSGGLVFELFAERNRMRHDLVQPPDIELALPPADDDVETLARLQKLADHQSDHQRQRRDRLEIEQRL